MALDIIEKAILNEIKGVTAGDRIYPQLIPQGVALPAIVYDVDIEDADSTLSSNSEQLNEAIFDFYALSTNYEQASTIVNEIEAILKDMRKDTSVLTVQGTFFIHKKVGAPTVENDETVYERQLRYRVIYLLTSLA
jgi:hypothetical protein